MKTGIELINEETQTQINTYGFTASYFKPYSNALLVAAFCYKDAARLRTKNGPSIDPKIVPNCWPFAVEWWEPSPDDRITELVKAGALFKIDYDLFKNEQSLNWMNAMAAEIDALQTAN